MSKQVAILVLVLGSIIAIGPLTIDLYLPAFLAISQDLATSQSNVQYSLSSYFVGMALGQLIYGPIIDRFGKKPPLIFGLIIYITTSLLCSFARDVDDLIIIRFFQALGACICIIAPRAIVRDIFSPHESAKIFSYLILVIGIAPIIAPLFGSMILAKFGWRAIFQISSLIGTMALLMTIFALPKLKAADPDDVMSAAFRKYIGILKDRNFVICSFSGGFAMATLFCFLTGSPILYLDFFHLSTVEYSLFFAVNSIGFMCFSQFNVYLLRKLSIEAILQKTLVITVFIAISLIFVSYFLPNLFMVSLLIFLIIGIVGIINPNTTALALANQAKHSGSASALFGFIQFVIASTLSIAIGYFNKEKVVLLLVIMSICGILSFLTFNLRNKLLSAAGGD